MEALQALRELGLLSNETSMLLQPQQGPDLTWKEFIAQQLNQKPDMFSDSLRQLAAERLTSNDVPPHVVRALAQFVRRHINEARGPNRLTRACRLGIFSDKKPMPKMGTPLDSLAAHLSKELAFGPRERDVVILHHHVETQKPDGQRVRHR